MHGRTAAKVNELIVIDSIARIVNPPWRMLTSTRGYTVFIVGYFVAALLVRFLLYPGASQDDAEQLVFMQTLAGGYNPAQPPLYTWLIWACARIVGPNLLAVLIVKYACLTATYLLMAAAARIILRDMRLGNLAGLGLFGLLWLGYDALFNYSNTIVETTAIAATLYALALLVGASDRRHYLLLGVTVGLGLLTKYAYLLFLVPLLASALTLPVFRARLLDRRLLLAVLPVVVLLLPHGVWAIIGDLNLQKTYSDRLQQPTLGYGEGVQRGFIKMANGILVFLSPLIVIGPLLLPAIFRRRFSPETELRPWRLLLERYLLALVAMLSVAIVALGMANVRTHYFFVLIAAPIWLILTGRLSRSHPLRFRGLAFILLCLAVGWLGALVGRYWIDVTMSQPRVYFNFPYPAFAAAIRETGFERGTMIAFVQRYDIAGNLRNQFPEARVYSLKYPWFKAPLAHRREVPACLDRPGRKARGNCRPPRCAKPVRRQHPGQGKNPPKHLSCTAVTIFEDDVELDRHSGLRPMPLTDRKSSAS